MSKQKYGFVYLWRDRKHNRYYVGSHWGTEDDGYVCSSRWMNKSYARRPNDFKRRILCIVLTNRADLLEREQYYLNMIKSEEVKIRYYNLMLSTLNPWYNDKNKLKTIGEKISIAKTGKKTGKRDPSIGAKISASKKGATFTEEHKQKLREAKIGTKRTEEWKLENGKRMKAIWAERRKKIYNITTEE